MSAESVHRERVLVVDDAPDTLRLLTDALEEAGMTVLVALDGESALQRAQYATPDVILLDAVMQGMDGFETCARLKQLSAVAHIPVIFMTGLTETEDVVKGFEAGGVDYVTKPIVPEQLIARIRAHLANARLVSTAHNALDLSGRAAFSLDSHGQVSWQTPEAARILQQMHGSGEADGALPEVVLERLLGRMRNHATSSDPLEWRVEGQRFVLTPIGRTSEDQLLVTLDVTSSTGQQERLQVRFALTARECEVLIWIARGKSNRDIGQILGLSPRTVNKHLERIYVKLGVENRASAAAVAIGALSERG